MKKTRIKSHIWGYLMEHGKGNTVQICEYLNKVTRDGTCVKQIGPILSREPAFECVGKEKIKSIMGGSYNVKIWKLRNNNE